MIPDPSELVIQDVNDSLDALSKLLASHDMEELTLTATELQRIELLLLNGITSANDVNWIEELWEKYNPLNVLEKLLTSHNLEEIELTPVELHQIEQLQLNGINTPNDISWVVNLKKKHYSII